MVLSRAEDSLFGVKYCSKVVSLAKNDRSMHKRKKTGSLFVNNWHGPCQRFLKIRFTSSGM